MMIQNSECYSEVWKYAKDMNLRYNKSRINISRCNTEQNRNINADECLKKKKRRKEENTHTKLIQKQTIHQVKSDDLRGQIKSHHITSTISRRRGRREE